MARPHQENFYSRTSCEVQRTPRQRRLALAHFYSRTSCEVQPKNLSPNLSLFLISTHAPHARCNLEQIINGDDYNISTHAPHARCNQASGVCGLGNIIFLLTHLMRGATVLSVLTSLAGLPISTHAPHARCNKIIICANERLVISTHAPHARCNQRLRSQFPRPRYFYSRTSCEVQPFQRYRIYIFSQFLLTHLMRGATRLDIHPTIF